MAAPFAIAVGLVAEVAGARALSAQAIGGIVFVTLALCTLLAADIILRSVLDAWVGGPGARWFRGVRNWPGGGPQLGAAGDPAGAAGRPRERAARPSCPSWSRSGMASASCSRTPVTAGNLDLSLGDVLWFFIGIALALAVARFVRFILDEDVLPRMPLAMGAASAASRLIYYALVVAGILFALAASGVELSKLTLLISALGVGIGFGLQNIVNNFVSGLILAFERPVREGDQITLGTTTGRVDVDRPAGHAHPHLRGGGSDRAERQPDLRRGHQLDAQRPRPAHRHRRRRGLRQRSGPRPGAVLLEAILDLPGVAPHPAAMTAFRVSAPARSISACCSGPTTSTTGWPSRARRGCGCCGPCARPASRFPSRAWTCGCGTGPCRGPPRPRRRPGPPADRPSSRRRWRSGSRPNWELNHAGALPPGLG